MCPISIMLKLISKYIVVISALSLSLIGLVTASTASQPATDTPISYIDRCGGEPCIMGLIPGHTLWQDAQRTLSVYQGEITDKQIVIAFSPLSEIAFYQSVDKTSVGRIQMRFEPPISMGWILVRFGQPCGITIYNNAGLLTLRYPFLLANIRLQTQHLRSDLPINSIQFTDPNFESSMQPNICVDNITDGARNRSWKGFAPVWSYLTRVD